MPLHAFGRGFGRVSSHHEPYRIPTEHGEFPCTNETFPEPEELSFMGAIAEGNVPYQYEDWFNIPGRNSGAVIRR
jgi:hypothetical protein